jgi:hypothetical protein
MLKRPDVELASGEMRKHGSLDIYSSPVANFAAGAAGQAGQLDPDLVV